MGQRKYSFHKDRPFVGVDGEGGDIGERHEYLLLRAGDRVLETGEPLTGLECLDFLAKLPPLQEYVSYYFDYDVTMMLRDLPEHVIRHLLDREGRVWSDRMPPAPVRWRGYEFDYLPHKEFRVRRQPLQRGDKPLWVIINDVGTFFQCSFLKALDRWGIGTKKQLADIERGKKGRNAYKAITPETRRYNKLEIELLETLMTQFRRICQEVGYVPRVWQGPGNMASAMLNYHGLPRTEDIHAVPDRVWQYAQNAYYGGRFETTAVGPVTGPVYQYDINSAYPYACTLLPCLDHSTWHHAVTLRGLGVYKIRFFHPSTKDALYSFPVRRKDGSIFYPRMGSGWYWYPEIQSAIANGCKVTVVDGWTVSKGCDCWPFGWVEDVYAERVRIGKSGKGMVLKLGLNSLYGKQAQSVGRAQYANPVYAGLITAITRGMLAEAYGQNINATVMLATDGIFTTEPLNLECGKGLGQWDLDIHESGMFVVQPGLYFAGDKQPKTRGVPLAKVLEKEHEFRSAWDESLWAHEVPRYSPGGNQYTTLPYPQVDISVRNFVGLRLAMARNKPETAGEWQEVTKAISFGWYKKRRPNKVTHDGRSLRTWPHAGDRGLVTVPYDRNIGGNLLRDLTKLEFDDQPEWAEQIKVRD